METLETGVDPYERGTRTLVAAWAENARGATNAAVLSFPGVAAAVFPDGREREFYRAAYHILIARSGIESVSAAMAFDFRTDCGIYNVGTVPEYRRRGFGTALTAAHLYDARERGCRTAGVQSTTMAEKAYTAVGFQDLGRFLEYIPASVPDGRCAGLDIRDATRPWFGLLELACDADQHVFPAVGRD